MAARARSVRMRPTWTHLQRVTMAPVKRTKDKRDSRRKIRKLVLNRRPLVLVTSAPTLVTASAMMAELGIVPLGPRQAV